MTPESETGTTRASEPASAPAPESMPVSPAGAEAPRVEAPPTPVGAAADTPPGADPQAAVPPGSARGSGAERSHQLERFARWSGAKLIQPRPRTIAVGIVLILIGTLAVSNSFWIFPLILVGVLMIVVAWVGSRLEGRFAIEWGESGAGIELTARLRAPAPVPRQIAPASSTPGPAERPRSVSAVSATAAPGSAAPAGTVETIEGEAHTMELDARELRALVAAIEAQAAALEGSGRVSNEAPPSRNGSSGGSAPPAL